MNDTNDTICGKPVVKLVPIPVACTNTAATTCPACNDEHEPSAKVYECRRCGVVVFPDGTFSGIPKRRIFSNPPAPLDPILADEVRFQIGRGHDGAAACPECGGPCRYINASQVAALRDVATVKLAEAVKLVLALNEKPWTGGDFIVSLDPKENLRLQPYLLTDRIRRTA